MKSKDFDRKFDDGEDVTGHLDLSKTRRPGMEQKRVNVDFPVWMVEMLDREAKRLGMTFYWYSPLPYCIYNPIARGLGNKSCAAVDGLISVTPSGDVLPCSSYHEPIGNLLHESFEKVWFSERGGYFKNKGFAPEECRTCESFLACQGACPLYWDYAGREEIRCRESVG